MTFKSFWYPSDDCQVDWGLGLNQLHLCRGVRYCPNECPVHDTKPFDTTTPSQSGPKSNGNEGVLHILQSSKTGASPSYT